MCYQKEAVGQWSDRVGQLKQVHVKALLLVGALESDYALPLSVGLQGTIPPRALIEEPARCEGFFSLGSDWDIKLNLRVNIDVDRLHH